MKQVTVVGGGLAGCEAALQLSMRGLAVTLAEGKRICRTPAQSSEDLAELVCSNSLKAEQQNKAGGLLKAELDLLNCQLLQIARENRVAAGGALAVDREAFSRAVTRRIEDDPNITRVDRLVEAIPQGPCIIATGPLTEGKLATEIEKLAGSLSFFDAASPIVMGESVNRDIAFWGNRYQDAGQGDYLNCPMDEAQYLAFWQALVQAETVPLKEFENNVFEGCMPVEVMAKRGPKTLAFGPLRPVGFTDPHTGRRPYAVVQLRREDEHGQSFNLVGFQTNLKFGEQQRVFGMIPGLERAEFTRFGVMHRNTFIKSPGFLNEHFQVIDRPELFFAGQITGVEGYVESIASGMLCGINMARILSERPLEPLPPESMLGALCRHVAGETADFQPMNANFGILPPLEKRIRNKQERYAAMAERSLQILTDRMEDYR